MKKILLFLTAFSMALSMFSCFGGEKEITYIDNVFLSEETLASYHFENLPVPEFENSRMDKEKPNVLYLNMSDQAFEGYCAEIANYLLSREDVFNVGIMHDVTLFVGPLFLPMSYDVYIPLCDNVSNLGDKNKFAFALDSELTTGWVTNGMRDAYEISVYRTDGELEGAAPYKYNTYIEVNEAKGVYEPCAKEHKYGEELSYPVPNTDIVIDIFYCTYCGSQGQSDYYGGADTNAYSISIINGRDYIEGECLRKYTINPSGYAGLEKEIKLPRTDGVEYIVTVNGFELPVVYEEKDYLIYGFIMPQCDIEIEITIAQ